MKTWAVVFLISSVALAQGDQPSQNDTAAGIAHEFQTFWQQRPTAPTADKIGSQQERAVFLKTQGCAKATFTVLPVAKKYKVGLFSQAGMRDAWVRISSDTVPRTPDHGKSTIGFAVKVLGVVGDKVLPGEENATTHDFLTQNHPVFFVNKAIDFLEFTRASLSGKFAEYAEAHPKTKEILDAMDKSVENVLGIAYWSTVPYKFGAGHVKYRVIPCKARPSEPIPPVNIPNYLQPRLERDLAAGGACFYLQVQVRDERRNSKTGQAEDLNPEPLDMATVEWREKFAKPVSVARIDIPAQDIKLNAAECEKMAFNPFRTLLEHRPVGTIGEARGRVYKHMSGLRRANTGAPVEEPKN